ncbi:hypothetical protein PHSY_001842 [Pseudozyma hubeiensis SY62]|uniref:Uncharacterized protein n=1 Tax=Pseudozyma hubeiensis (strain SY62) TaxID=1305764 RepID=R9NZP0_PSEHS|nr:hypothetical protein PHSY_001842 [Pseudozyma hubeiensis SY62]GAC94271.1 hypothetical protein PHSY_001842 [Pseudozyma hubeiensis SY62]
MDRCRGNLPSFHSNVANADIIERDRLFERCRSARPVSDVSYASSKGLVPLSSTDDIDGQPPSCRALTEPLYTDFFLRVISIVSSLTNPKLTSFRRLAQSDMEFKVRMYSHSVCSFVCCESTHEVVIHDVDWRVAVDTNQNNDSKPIVH